MRAEGLHDLDEDLLGEAGDGGGLLFVLGWGVNKMHVVLCLEINSLLFLSGLLFRLLDLYDPCGLRGGDQIAFNCRQILSS